jgi:hypothetical protein
VGRLRGIPDVHKALVLLVSRKESETPQIPCLNCLKLLPLSFSVPIPSVLPLGSHPQCSPSAGKSYQNLPEEGSIGESGRGAMKSGKSRQKKQLPFQLFVLLHLLFQFKPLPSPIGAWMS